MGPEEEQGPGTLASYPTHPAQKYCLGYTPSHLATAQKEKPWQSPSTILIEVFSFANTSVKEIRRAKIELPYLCIPKFVENITFFRKVLPKCKFLKMEFE